MPFAAPSASGSVAEDALSWTSWSGSTWERVLVGRMSTSNGVVPLDEVREDIDRAARRLRTATLRAGTVGAALKGGLNLLRLLARARRKPKRKGVLRVAAVDAARDTVAFASFLATFAGIYVAVDEGLAMGYGRTRSREWRAAVAGAIAAPALLLADPRGCGHTGRVRDMPLTQNTKTQNEGHHGLATYLALRAAVLLTRSALKKREKGEYIDDYPMVHTALAPFASKHADVGLMSAAATVILSCFIMKPDALIGPYANFLNRHGGKTVPHYRALGDFVLSKNGKDARETLSKAAVTLKQPFLLTVLGSMDDKTLMASRPHFWRLIIHPGENSLHHFFKFLLSSWQRSVSVNAPLYLVSTMVVHRTRLFDPKLGPEIFKRSMLGTCRSSLFLSTYCALAWLGPDCLQTLTGKANWLTVFSGVPTAGLATFIEKPSRRQELSVYCASRAVEAAAVCCLSWGLVPQVVQKKLRVDVLTFLFASSAIMRCYSNERDVFKSKYLNVLDFVFGNQGHGKQRVKHVGSVYQIATQAPAMATPPTSPEKRK